MSHPGNPHSDKILGDRLIANERADRTADNDDRAAGVRDRLAEARSIRARKAEERHGGIDRVGERARRHAASDRLVAAADRARAADDRARARSERRTASELRAWSTIDSTTGLMRREAGLPALVQLDHRSRPTGYIVIAFVDVDGLKRVNDVRGHRAGDAVLRAVAVRLAASFGHQDVVMRYGGDEFLIGAADITLADMSSRLTHVSLDLWEECDAGISFGTAVSHEHTTLDDAIEHADRALYATRRRIRPA